MLFFQDIKFTNLPATTSQHENYDGEYQILQILTSDANGAHDNVTCEMTSYSPAESNMFQLRTDYQYKNNCKFDTYFTLPLEQQISTMLQFYMSICFMIVHVCS